MRVYIHWKIGIINALPADTHFQISFADQSKFFYWNFFLHGLFRNLFGDYMSKLKITIVRTYHESLFLFESLLIRSYR